MSHFQKLAGHRATMTGTPSDLPDLPAMRLPLSLSSIRTAVLGALCSFGVLAGAPNVTEAQVVTASYACGPSAPCSEVRFSLLNNTAFAFELNDLRLFSTGAAYAFSTAGIPEYTGMDDLGIVGGFTTVGPLGADVFIDFLESVGGPFTVGAGSTGYVNVALAGAPPLTGAAFAYSASLQADQSIRGNVVVAGTSTVPEPSTYALLATGLGTLGLIARRRRAA